MSRQGGAQVEREIDAAEERGHLRGGFRRFRHGHLLLPPQRRQLLPDLKVMLEVSDSSSFDTEYVTIVCIWKRYGTMYLVTCLTPLSCGHPHDPHLVGGLI